MLLPVRPRGNAMMSKEPYMVIRRSATVTPDRWRPMTDGPRRPDLARRCLAVVALSAVLATAAGCGSGSASTSKPTGDQAIVIVPPAKREAPVDLAGKTLDGQPLSLAGLRGKPVLLNIWASWCAPCRKEAPELVKAYARLQPRGVTFVGIDTRDTSEAASAFVRNFGLPYPSLVDDGQMLLALRGAVPPSAIPSTVILDDQGRIAGRVLGAVSESTLVGMVEEATGLASPQTSSR